jgi:serine protease Do
MHRYVASSIVLLPLLLGFSQAAQNGSVDPVQPYVFSSEESGTGSYLGVDISDVTTERLSALKLKEEKGVEVTMVDQDAPAGKAGIKEHDVILTMNGTAIESGAQLRRMIHEMPPGRIVTFGLSREGQPVSVKVQLADKGKEFAMTGHNMNNFHVHVPEIHIPDIDIPSINMVMVTSSARSGLMVENITPQLGEFFGVKNGNGVLVRSVEKGSRAEKAGFHAGDVIVKVDDQPVHDTSDFMHAVKSRNGAAMNVGVVRDKKEQNLNLSLPDKKESGELLEEEESLQGPFIDAESADELSELGQEVAELQPQMELAAEDLHTSATERRTELRSELCGQQDKLRHQAERLRNQSRLQQRQLKRDQEKLKLQLNRLRQERLGHEFDI